MTGDDHATLYFPIVKPWVPGGVVAQAKKIYREYLVDSRKENKERWELAERLLTDSRMKYLWGFLKRKPRDKDDNYKHKERYQHQAHLNISISPVNKPYFLALSYAESVCLYDDPARGEHLKIEAKKLYRPPEEWVLADFEREQDLAMGFLYWKIFNAVCLNVQTFSRVDLKDQRDELMKAKEYLEFISGICKKYQITETKNMKIAKAIDEIGYSGIAHCISQELDQPLALAERALREGDWLLTERYVDDQNVAGFVRFCAGNLTMFGLRSAGNLIAKLAAVAIGAELDGKQVNKMLEGHTPPKEQVFTS